MISLAGRHAVVTGGGTGIGAAIARGLAAEGAKLTLVGRRREKLEDVARELPGVVVAPADVTDRTAVQAAFKEGRAKHGPIAILINNAGIAPTGPFAKVSEVQWQEVMAVNLDAVFHCCQAALDDLLAAEAGRIVTVASSAGLRGFPYTAPYVATKHGAVGLTRALAVEFAKTRLTVNAVCPGFANTELVAESIARMQAAGRGEAQARDTLAQLNPGGRLLTPDEIAAEVIALVASDRSGEAVEIG